MRKSIGTIQIVAGASATKAAPRSAARVLPRSAAVAMHSTSSPLKRSAEPSMPRLSGYSVEIVWSTTSPAERMTRKFAGASARSDSTSDAAFS